MSYVVDAVLVLVAIVNVVGVALAVVFELFDRGVARDRAGS